MSANVSAHAPSARTLRLLENIEVGPPRAEHEVRIEPIAKRVRALVGGVPIADSCRTVMMFETRRLAVYYFPIDDVRTDLLVPSALRAQSPVKGEATYYSLLLNGRVIENAAWRYLDPPAGGPDIANLIAFHWNRMDSWLEEDEEVFVHARDPYHRIDVLQSFRPVRVTLDGHVVADTTKALFLFETGLPTRYYIPREDVRWDLLQPSATATACAYKGSTSAYWSKRSPTGRVRDVAWMYEAPAAEVARIAGRVAFFNERVDAIFVDGVEMPRPVTPWSD